MTTESLRSIAMKIDAISEQENKLYNEQNLIHIRLMNLKGKKSKLITKFIQTSGNERQ